MPLTEEIISECLSLLCKTGDGLAHAYVRLDVHERYEAYIEYPYETINDIFITRYVHDKTSCVSSIFSGPSF